MKQTRFDLGLHSGRWQVIWFGSLATLEQAPGSLGIYTFFKQLNSEEHPPAVVAKLVSMPHMVLLPIGTVLDGDTDLIVGMNMPSGRSRRRALDLDLSDVNTELVLRSEIAAVGPAKHWAGDAKYEGGLIRVAGTASHPEIYIPCAVLFQFFWG